MFRGQLEVVLLLTGTMNSHVNPLIFLIIMSLNFLCQNSIISILIMPNWFFWQELKVCLLECDLFPCERFASQRPTKGGHEFWSLVWITTRWLLFMGFHDDILILHRADPLRDVQRPPGRQAFDDNALVACLWLQCCVLLLGVTHEIHKHGCGGGGSTGGIHFPSCINCPTYNYIQQTATLQVSPTLLWMRLETKK